MECVPMGCHDDTMNHQLRQREEGWSLDHQDVDHHTFWPGYGDWHTHIPNPNQDLMKWQPQYPKGIVWHEPRIPETGAAPVPKQKGKQHQTTPASPQQLMIKTYQGNWSSIQKFKRNNDDQRLIKGSLEVKLPTIWTDGKAEVGRAREEKSRREKIREEKESEERRCRCVKR